MEEWTRLRTPKEWEIFEERVGATIEDLLEDALVATSMDELTYIRGRVEALRSIQTMMKEAQEEAENG